MLHRREMRRAAIAVWQAALFAVDARSAVRRALYLDGQHLKCVDSVFNLDRHMTEIYAVAIGKAAVGMAAALDEAIEQRLTAGVLSGATEDADAIRVSHAPARSDSLSSTVAALSRTGRWRIYSGGHPVPDKASLDSARYAIRMLRRADHEHALVIFLISGGGSSMMELPRSATVTLGDLRRMNVALTRCGASIGEVNRMRKAVSAIKGGGLSACAPRARQVSLIISDTPSGEEAAVASGPTYPATGSFDASDVIARYRIEEAIPRSVMRVLAESARVYPPKVSGANRANYVLLTNEDAIKAASAAARERGFAVRVARDITDNPVAEGCAKLVARLRALSRRVTDSPVCLVSGGEFSCPVNGTGKGGRNSETVLRLAMAIDRAGSNAGLSPLREIVALSAGTDGIDGNSPAAGALADTTTIDLARKLDLDAGACLGKSDSYSFFSTLRDAIVTGPTGTNVRDLRILLAE